MDSKCTECPKYLLPSLPLPASAAAMPTPHLQGGLLLGWVSRTWTRACHSCDEHHLGAPVAGRTRSLQGWPPAPAPLPSPRQSSYPAHSAAPCLPCFPSSPRLCTAVPSPGAPCFYLHPESVCILPHSGASSSGGPGASSCFPAHPSSVTAAEHLQLRLGLLTSLWHGPSPGGVRGTPPGTLFFSIFLATMV